MSQRKEKKRDNNSGESEEMSCPCPSRLHPQPKAEVWQRRGGAALPGVGAGGRKRG